MNRITLHPEILSKNGKKEFVVLPYEEFLALQELLDDVEDLLELRAAKQESDGEPSLSLTDAKKELGLS
jgi:hypothetical protein